MSYPDLPFIDEIDDLAGRTVFLRVDLNVTLDAHGDVADDFRIQAALPTIERLRGKGARLVIASHLKHNKEPVSLRSVSNFLQNSVPHVFADEVYADDGKCVWTAFDEGAEIVLLENLRLHSGETEGDPDFARFLAGFADLYVNDAFAVSHREHASVVGIPEFLRGYAGLLMRDEVHNLSEAFTPSHPFLFMLGGAKFETKVPLIRKFLDRADTVFVGGALAHDIFQERGYNVGDSLVADTDMDISDVVDHPGLMVPSDVVVEVDGRTEVRKASEVSDGETIWDAGPETIERLKAQINDASFILWNGPLGNYEIGYIEPTHELARAVAASPAESIVGGGDTLTAIDELGLVDDYSFVSTGGGAMLDFLAHEDLPGLRALREAHRL